MDNNDYKCEACKRRVPATKQFSLERAPKVLCVQLKRFSVLGGKISRHIGFKQTVDMGPHLWREPGEPERHLNYKLMSMVTHMGPSVNCGHYTAVAQVSTGQYYSFDDACVRPINLGNVLNTNAYIMIFEMESPTQSQSVGPQSTKVNGSAVTKTIPNGIMVKLPGKPSTSAIPAYCSEPANGVTKKFSCDPETPIGTLKNLNSSTNAQNKSTNFIGPQLPAKMLDKTQPRLVMHIKNGKVLSGSSLVPYDGSSEEEDPPSGQSKIQTSNPNTSGVKNNTANAANGLAKISGVKETSNTLKTPAISKESTLKTTKNGSPIFSAEVRSSKPQAKTLNGSSTGNGVSSSPAKHQNGKTESNGRIVETNGKDKCHPIRVKTGGGSEDKVLTKAAASSMNGWQVSKDAPSPTSGSTANGWSVTDNKCVVYVKSLMKSSAGRFQAKCLSFVSSLFLHDLTFSMYLLFLFTDCFKHLFPVCACTNLT